MKSSILLVSITLAGAVAASEADVHFPLKRQDAWQAPDPKVWKWSPGPEVTLKGQSDWEPPVRRPRNLIWFEDARWKDFMLEVEVRLTTFNEGNNDLCIAFAGTDERHFYYAHLGETADEVHLHLHRVNDGPREAITAHRADSLPWKKGRWHAVKLVREGPSITVFFDGEQVLTAKDDALGAGRIGLGSFDDTGEFRELRIVGKPVP